MQGKDVCGHAASVCVCVCEEKCKASIALATRPFCLHECMMYRGQSKTVKIHNIHVSITISSTAHKKKYTYGVYSNEKKSI